MNDGGGALVLSLDFELHWGVRDRESASGPYRANLLGARTAVPAILELFEEFEMAATWATVGCLFATDRAELIADRPTILPRYTDSSLSPEVELLGNDESDDPLHFAPSLIDGIRSTPRQEIGTHTFFHYYCLEPGQDRDSFRADLQSAVAIAVSRGIVLRSIVLPRNQHHPAYDDILRDCGIIAYRGNPLGWTYRPGPGQADILPRRASRLLDSYLPRGRDRTFSWSSVLTKSGLANVPASFFLRPVNGNQIADSLRFRRLSSALERAAKAGRLLHLWWHPHNFGRHPERNLAFLRRLLEDFSSYRRSHQMRSLSMVEVAREAGVAE